MATFKFGRAIDLHWQGYEIVGPAETVFSIPDQLYEEFNDDIAPVEPTLVWIDTNEFLTLSNSVSVTSLTGTIPISVTTTTSGKVIAISSTTNPAGYYLRADGTGATTWAALPADATGITNIIGTSPISAAVSGTTATISLNANYQTAGSYQPSGTYVTGVVGTSPISASGTTSITVSLGANYQTAGTYVNAVIGTSPASVSTASGTSTVSIVAGSINSTHLSATSVGSSQLIAQAVGTAALSSGAAANGTILTSNGSGGATFASAPASGGYYVTGTSLVNGANLTSMATGGYLVGNPDSTSIEVISSAGVTSTVAQYQYVYSSQRTSTSTRFPVMSSWVSAALTTSTANAGSRFVNGEFWIFGTVSTAASAGLHRSSDSTSWTSVTSGLAVGDVIQDIAYNGSNLYVLCGRDNAASVGKVSTSPGTSGSTWTARTINVNMEACRGVTSSGSRWVVVGSGGAGATGETLTSTDGITWASNSSGAFALDAVAFGASTFVAVGSAGKIYTSPSTSGSVWTLRTSGVTTDISDVTYANGIFAACTASAVLSSSDGITWTSSSVGGAAGAIVYATFTNNGSMWVVTSSSNNWAKSSNNLTSWTTGTRGNLSNGGTISYNNNILLSANTLARVTRAVETTSFNSVWNPVTVVTA